MKPRKPLPRRKAFLKRGAPPKKLNVERAKRKRDKYAAHLKSAHFRWVKSEVRKRSGGRCERKRRNERLYAGGETFIIAPYRCPNPGAVFNHTTYVHVPNEPPEDVEHLCKSCDREYEGARPWRAARRAALSRAEKAAS